MIFCCCHGRVVKFIRNRCFFSERLWVGGGEGLGDFLVAGYMYVCMYVCMYVYIYIYIYNGESPTFLTFPNYVVPTSHTQPDSMIYIFNFVVVLVLVVKIYQRLVITCNSKQSFSEVGCVDRNKWLACFSRCIHTHICIYTWKLNIKVDHSFYEWRDRLHYLFGRYVQIGNRHFTINNERYMDYRAYCAHCLEYSCL